jgi:uncharacterized protein
MTTNTALKMIGAASLLAGAATGVLAGMFGVGGGIVIVPVLYELFGLYGVPDPVRMPLCIGTSLAIIAPTSISSFRGHLRKGAVEKPILKIWAGPVVVGVIISAALAAYAAPSHTKHRFSPCSGYPSDGPPAPITCARTAC